MLVCGQYRFRSGWRRCLHRRRPWFVAVRLGAGLRALPALAALAAVAATASAVAPPAAAFAGFRAAGYLGRSMNDGGGVGFGPRLLRCAWLAWCALTIWIALSIAPILAWRASARFASCLLSLRSLWLALALRFALSVFLLVVALSRAFTLLA